MGEHRVPHTLGDKPGHRSTEKAPPKYVHVSKELHMEPVMVPGVDDKGRPVMKQAGYQFVLYRGDGKTFVKPGKRTYVPQSNDWGAEWYKLHRERSDAAYQVRLAQMAMAAESC